MLSSDSIIPSFTRWVSMKPIIEQFPETEHVAFRSIGYTMGGMMVWPANMVGSSQTINGARGFRRKIADRMDLTLECVRRYYLGEPSPLADTFVCTPLSSICSAPFAATWTSSSFRTWWTTGTDVRFFMHFDDFQSPSVPGDVETYREYRRPAQRRVHRGPEQADRHYRCPVSSVERAAMS